MAKKKGGKKGKHNRDQSVTSPESGEAQFKSEQATLPEETPVSQESSKEPELATAVSEVIGDQGGKDKKSTKKFKTQLAKFTADGYDVSPIEAMLDSASSSEIKDAIRNFEEGTEKNKAIINELGALNFTGFESEVEELKKLLAEPLSHKTAAEKFASLKFKRRSAEIISALDKMVLPAMKPKAEALKSRIAESSSLDAIEIEFSELKREYKEAYAEEGVKAQVVMAEPEQAPTESQRSRTPMKVKDIFLLYKDGRFISHHTNRVVSKEQQKELFGDLKTGRNFLRSPKYVAQKLNVIPVENRHILVQSGRFTVVIVITEGSVDPWSEKIVTKVITLMEKEDAIQLKAWNGDVASLKSSGKYMQALLFAFMKLANKGTQ